MTDAAARQASYIPSCSQQAQYCQYDANGAAAFTPNHGSYFEHKVPVMLPGAIIGAVCLAAGLAFLSWVSQNLTSADATSQLLRAAVSTS